MDSCKDCCFFRNEASQQECHRYPQMIHTGPDDWCGEFKLPEPIRIIPGPQPVIIHENPKPEIDISREPEPEIPKPIAEEKPLKSRLGRKRKIRR